MESDELRRRKANLLKPPSYNEAVGDGADLIKNSPFNYPDSSKKRNSLVPDYVGEDRDGSNGEEEDEHFPQSFLIIEFTRSTSSKTIHWLIDKIRAKKSTGGAELLVNREQITPNCEGLTIHISARDEQLLAMADEAGFIKKTKSGILRNFNVSCIDDFLLSSDMRPIDILTPADKQIAMTNALDNIRASGNEYFVPGYEGQIPLYKGERILDACIKANVIYNYYTPHDYKIAENIGPKWYKNSCNPIIEMIRNYFGENFGIYFSFLIFYTMSLTVPSIFGITMVIFGYESVPVMCVAYVIWTTVFLEIWKRRCSEHAYNWGTITMTYLDKPRAAYYGKLGVDPITGKTTPQYPMWKTYVQMYLVSYPIVISGAALAFYMALSQFWAEDYLRQFIEEDSYFMYLPSIIQAILVAFFSIQCESLAAWLTIKENHRTQLQHDRHRINKLIILEFFNNFISLFYIAFILKDIQMLKKQLMVQLTIIQLAQNFQEMIMSWMYKLVSKTLCRFSQNTEPSKETEVFSDEAFDYLNLETLPIKNHRVAQSQKEKFLPEYNSTFQDYLQLWIQFGYVVLFSSVVPMAALFALVNNVIEIRLDIFKLGWLYKRPFAERAKDTASWQLAFETIAIISIMTNLGIAYMTPEIREFKPLWTDIDWTFNLIALEHVLLILIWCIHRLIPDRPNWVRIALAKADYHSQQALKREAIQRSKFIKLRRFKSVHGPTSPHFTYNKCPR